MALKCIHNIIRNDLAFRNHLSVPRHASSARFVPVRSFSCRSALKWQTSLFQYTLREQLYWPWILLILSGKERPHRLAQYTNKWKPTSGKIDLSRLPESVNTRRFWSMSLTKLRRTCRKASNLFRFQISMNPAKLLCACIQLQSNIPMQQSFSYSLWCFLLDCICFWQGQYRSSILNIVYQIPTCRFRLL